MGLVFGVLARPDGGEEALVYVPGQGLAGGLPVQNDRALERVNEGTRPLTVLEVHHELDLEFFAEFSVEVLRKALNELPAVVQM
jgi:hypothetical protein